MTSVFGGREDSPVWPVRKEIAAARELGERLEPADERNEVERGVERTAHDALAADRAADGDQCHRPAQPRERSYQTAGQSSSGITPELL